MPRGRRKSSSRRGRSPMQGWGGRGRGVAPRRRRIKKLTENQLSQAQLIARTIGKTAGANFIDRVLR